MYAFLWRRLPGGLPGKLVGMLALLLGVLALLWFVAFPWAENSLPFNNVNVSGGGSGGVSSSVTPTTSQPAP
jgi:hypothetical protein